MDPTSETLNLFTSQEENMKQASIVYIHRNKTRNKKRGQLHTVRIEPRLLPPPI